MVSARAHAHTCSLPSHTHKSWTKVSILYPLFCIYGISAWCCETVISEICSLPSETLAKPLTAKVPPRHDIIQKMEWYPPSSPTHSPFPLAKNLCAAPSQHAEATLVWRAELEDHSMGWFDAKSTDPSQSLTPPLAGSVAPLKHHQLKHTGWVPGD